VAVDDAGRRRLERRDAGELRLELAGLARLQHAQVRDAVGARLSVELLQAGDLPRIGGDDQLAAAPVDDAAPLEVGVQRGPARDAQPRLERARGVVDAGVDHLAVARARPGSNRPFALEHHDLAACEREGARHREADHASADHHGIDFLG